MQTAVNSLSEWSTKNNMGLNPTKCQQMEISFMRNPPVPPVIRISDHTSEVVDALKLLGIHIQSDLKWETHILNIVKRLLKGHGLPSCDLLIIYLGYIRPILEYAAPVWNSGLTRNQCERLK